MISYLLGELFGSTTLYLFIICTILYYFSTSTYDTWRKLNVPYAQPMPLFGNIFRFIMMYENQMETFDRIYRQFPDKKICGFYQMRTPFLMIRDPELINTIMIKDFPYFTDHGIDLDPSVNLLARSLFMLNGQRWKIMRQHLSPGFTSGKLKGTYKHIKDCSEQLMRCIEGKSKKTDQIEVKEIIGNFTTEVIGTSAFGLKLDTIKNENSDFRKYTAKIFGNNSRIQMVRNIIGMLFPKFAKLIKLQITPHDAIEFFESVIGDVIKYRSEENVIRNDLTQTLMQARNDLVINGDMVGEEKFCELDIIANAVLFFSAGADPVAIALSFCLYELALNEYIQDKLRAEINLARKNHGEHITNDFLVDLHYANMVIEETLRKYPIAMVIMREATQDYEISSESLHIKKGQKIIIPTNSLHYDSKYYSKPNIFDPERFNAEEKSKRLNGTYLPFGDGPRHCIGKRFAELEMKLILSEILSKFKVQPCEKTDIPLEMKIGAGFLTPKNGIWLSFKPLAE